MSKERVTAGGLLAMAGTNKSWLEAYRGLSEPIGVKAEAMARAAAGGAWLTELTPVPDQLYYQLYRQMMMVHAEAAGRSMPRAFWAAFEVVAAEARRRNLHALDSVEQSAITQVHYDLWGTLHEARQAVAAGDAALALARIDAGEAKLAALPQEQTPRHRTDTALLQTDFALCRAEAWHAAASEQRTFESYVQALDVARRADLDLGEVRHHPNVALSFASWAQGHDPDTALRQFLPIATEALVLAPSLERVKLHLLMIEFYARHGDVVGTEEAIQRFDTALDQLGFAPTRTGDYLDVVEGWVHAAQWNSRDRTQQVALFNTVIEGRMRCAWARQALGRGDPDLVAEIDALHALFEDKNAVDAEFFPDELRPARDHADVTPGAAASDTDRRQDAPVSSPEEDVLAQFRVLDERWQADETSDALIEALATLAAHPACTALTRGACHFRIGWIHAERKAWDEAEAALGEAVREYALVPDLVKEIEAETQRIGLHFAVEDYDRAAATAREVIVRIEGFRDRVSAAYLGSSFMANKTMPYKLGIVAAYKAACWEDMLQWMEHLKARELQRLPAGREEDEELRGRLRRLSDEFREAFARADPALTTLASRRRMVWDQIVLSHQRSRQVFHLAELQTRLRGKAIVLDYFFLSETEFLRCCLDGTRFLAEKISLEDQPAFFAAIEAMSSVSYETSATALDFEAIAPVLLPESMAPMIDAAPQVIVCAHQILHQVPFAALPWRGAPLITQKPVGMVPNVTCLLSDLPIATRPLSFLGIGTETSRDEFFRPQPRLRNASRELVSLADDYRAKGFEAITVRDAEVTRAALRAPAIEEALKTARIVQISLHGSDVADDSVAAAPMEARLYLHDAPIDGLDVHIWSLDADLVVLGACHAGKRAVRREGLARLPADTVFGLQAALHQAGARAVIAPLWRANDKSATAFASFLHQALILGETPARALQQAIIRYLETTSTRRRDPYFWACFMLVGFSSAAFGLSTSSSGRPS